MAKPKHECECGMVADAITVGDDEINGPLCASEACTIVRVESHHHSIPRLYDRLDRPSVENHSVYAPSVLYNKLLGPGHI